MVGHGMIGTSDSGSVSASRSPASHRPRDQAASNYALQQLHNALLPLVPRQYAQLDAKRWKEITSNR